MKKKIRNKKIDEIQRWCQQCGLSKTSQKTFTKLSGHKLTRIRIKRESVRFEEFDNFNNNWKVIKRGNIKDVFVHDNNLLGLM